MTEREREREMMLPQHCWLKAVQFSHVLLLFLFLFYFLLVVEKVSGKKVAPKLYNRRPNPEVQNLIKDFMISLF